MRKLFDINNPVMRLLARVVDLIILNTLFILTSLGIVTIGASFCALQTSIQKLLRHTSGSLVRDYFRIFRENFKNATIAWLGILALALILFLDFRLIGRLPIVAEFFMGAAAIILSIVTGVVAVYIFALIGRYENPLKTSLRNIAVLSLQNLFQTLFLLVYNGFIIYFTFTSPAALLTMIYILTFGGFAFINLGSGVMIKQVFDKIEKTQNNKRET
jgi:uncharacterized membrane protein YesL